jgi:hypothetical protein
MEWIIGIGVLWFLAAMVGKSSQQSSSESNAQEKKNWLSNVEKAANDAARRMSLLANEAEDKAWSRSIFADLEHELELHRVDQDSCIETGTKLLAKTKAEATEIRSQYLEAFRMLSEHASEPTRVPPIFNGIEFLKFEIKLDQLFIANLTTDEGRNELLKRKHQELLRSARLLARQYREEFRTIYLGRFHQGWSSYPIEPSLRLSEDDRTERFLRNRPQPSIADRAHFSDAWQGQDAGRTREAVLLSINSNFESHIDYIRQNGINFLYHFTDSGNFSSIVNSGGLFSWLYCEKNGIEIERPGGSALSRELDVRSNLENFVRLSFSKDHPMLYAAKRDGRLVDPVVLEIDLRVILLQSKPFLHPWPLFSNRNATANGAEIGRALDDLKKVRFDLIRSGRWANDDEKGLLQAEVLVPQAIPGYLIRRNGRPLRNPTSAEAARLSFLS